MEGSSSISSQGHWTMEAIMNWVIWDIYEWCLLFHGGAVLRGGRKPMAELPNVAVQTALTSFIYGVYDWTAVE